MTLRGAKIGVKIKAPLQEQEYFLADAHAALDGTSRE